MGVGERLRLDCVDVERGGRERGIEERGGGGCVKALVNKNLMGTEKAVDGAVSGGSGGAPVMLWVIGWTRAWKELVKVSI